MEMSYKEDEISMLDNKDPEQTPAWTAFAAYIQKRHHTQEDDLVSLKSEREGKKTKENGNRSVPVIMRHLDGLATT